MTSQNHRRTGEIQKNERRNAMDAEKLAGIFGSFNDFINNFMDVIQTIVKYFQELVSGIRAKNS